MDLFCDYRERGSDSPLVERVQQARVGYTGSTIRPAEIHWHMVLARYRGEASNSFWLHGSAWQFPDYENVDIFVNRLAAEEVLVRDPLVNDVLQDRPPELSVRTIRHRFLRATGLTQGQIRQFERARRAAKVLQQGATILDTVFEAGYSDQPHLTRSLKHWIGHTPAQLPRPTVPE